MTSLFENKNPTRPNPDIPSRLTLFVSVNSFSPKSPGPHQLTALLPPAPLASVSNEIITLS